MKVNSYGTPVCVDSNGLEGVGATCPAGSTMDYRTKKCGKMERKPASSSTAAATATATSTATPTATATLSGTSTTGLYGILVAVFGFVLTLVVLFTTGSLFAVLVLWLMMALIVSVLVYYGLVDLETFLDDLFPPAVKASAKEPGATATLAGGPLVGSEVFHINEPIFTYDQAEAVCAAYDSQLASLEQIIDAYNHGAEWCSYGWSAGGMALYPTQKSTWEQLQNEPDTGRRTRCGRPGVNGGYFDPSTKFGVNCFGFKPKGDFKPPAPVPGTDPTAFRDMVNRFKDMLKSFNLSPYSRKEWSGYDSTIGSQVQSYGKQFAQDIGKLREGFEPGDSQFSEDVTDNASSRTAAPLGPYGLRGDLGPTGPRGPLGPASTVPGPTGPQGLQGPYGPASTVPGPTGPQGLQGQEGSMGLRGYAGPTGATGPVGRAAAQGATGPSGTPGTAGATGPAGPMGPTGAQGRIDPAIISTVNDLKTNALRKDATLRLEGNPGWFLEAGPSGRANQNFKGDWGALKIRDASQRAFA
jgi:hypothetical protein